MPPRRFPPPWTVEETDVCYIVRDANGQALDLDRRSAAHLLTRDEARRIRRQHRQAAEGATAVKGRNDDV